MTSPHSVETDKINLAFILSPNYARGAPGHYETWPRALASAFEKNGYRTAIVTSRGTFQGKDFLKNPRAGYGLIHPRFPVLNLSILFRLRKIEQRLGAGSTLIHLLDGRPESIFSLAPLLIRRHRILVIYLNAELNRKLKKLEEILLRGLQANGRALIVCPESLSVSKQVFHGTMNIQHLFSLAPLLDQRCVDRTERHKKILVVARGSRMARKFEELAQFLCSKCRFEYHYPLDSPPRIHLPSNVSLADRTTIGDQYFQYMLDFDFHVYMYDEQKFKLVSGRALDSSRLGVPCIVPAGTQTESIIRHFGGFEAIDFHALSELDSLSHRNNFVPWTDKRPQSVEDHVYLLKSELLDKLATKHGFTAIEFLAIFLVPIIQGLFWFVVNVGQKLESFISKIKRI